jgi:tetratricopeptide (TPR) repeat protein
MLLKQKSEIAMKTNLWKPVFLCIVGISILFIALPAFAESALQVKCLDATGAGVKDVKVVIIPLKPPQKMKDKKSDVQGGAEFTKLEDGAYRVIGRKEGFAPALFEFAVLKGSAMPVTLKLEAGADKKLYFEDELELKKAEALMGQGLEAYKASKWADAEKSFAESLASNPSNADVLYYLSISRLQQGKYDEGLVALNRTVDVAGALMTVPSANPSGPNPYEQIYQSALNVKQKLPGIKAENALRQKNYDQAVKEFSELIKTSPNEPDFHANLAIAQYNLRKYDEALAAIDNAIKLKPGAYDDMKKTIVARKESAQLEKAQTILDEGTKLLQDGDATAALKKFEEAKSMVAQDKQWPIWRQIARAQGKLNQPEAAASFKKAIELAPADKQAEVRNAFAQYYLDQKKYDDALDTILDPKSTESPEKVLLGLAKTTMSKEPKMAKAALERVVKVNPDNLDAAFDLGQMYYSDKDNDPRAKELLTKYAEKGQDADKVQRAKDMMVLINRRNK